MRPLLLLSAAAAAALASAPAFAQTDVEEPAICTDRPTKANATCTVPGGRLQLETDLLNGSRLEAGGVRTDVVLYASPTLKVGLDDRSDVQVNWTPYVEVESRSGGVTDRIDGSGDVVVRYKRRLSADDASVSWGLIPFVKVPVGARGVSNREWEGGIAAPISMSVGGGTTLTFGPELDVLVDADGEGHHLQVVNLVNLSRPISSRVSIASELWMANNFDPDDTVTQASADVAVIWAVSRRLQLDVGANFGLTRETPDVQLYAGLSTRF